MATQSRKSRPATSSPKTRQGQRQMSRDRTTIERRDRAPEGPHEQERGETKSRPGARDERRPRRGNIQMERKGKTRSLVTEELSRPPRGGRDNESGQKRRAKPARTSNRTGKSTASGSRKSRSASTRKNSRSSATGTRRRQTGKKSGTKARTSRQ